MVCFATVVVFTLPVVIRVTVMMGKDSMCVFGRQSRESREGGDLVHRLVHLRRRVLPEAEGIGREQEGQQD